MYNTDLVTYLQQFEKLPVVIELAGVEYNVVRVEKIEDVVVYPDGQQQSPERVKITIG